MSAEAIDHTLPSTHQPERSLGLVLRAMALPVLLLIALAHAVFVWGHTGLFWGDSGVLLHQIERFAAGDVVYRDFLYTAPPFSLWLIGSLARVVGTDVTSVFLITNMIFFAIVAVFWAYVARLLPQALALPTAVAGLVLGIAMVKITGGAPLPLGMYTPAAPVGFLCLLGMIVLAIPLTEASGTGRAVLVGVLAALCVLTKHDFWAPALFLLGAISFLRFTQKDTRTVLFLGAAFAVTLGAGIALIAAGSGWASLLGVASSYGIAREFGVARGFPSWERLTVEMLVLSLLGIGLMGCLALGKAAPRRTLVVMGVFALCALAFAALYLYMNWQVWVRVSTTDPGLWKTPLEDEFFYRAQQGRSFFRTTIKILLEVIQLHLFPTLLPIVVGGIVLARWQTLQPGRLRLLVLVLLGLCIAARLRRGFEYTEWYSYLLELPTYVLALQLFFGEHARRAALIGLTGLALLGLFNYWYYGTGLMTRRGDLPRQETPRGTVRWPNNLVHNYRDIRDHLNRIDPSGRRPVFSFGHNGGFNYYLSRPNPTPITFGFTTAVIEPDSAVALVRSLDPPPFLIYHRTYEGVAIPDARIDLTRWDLAVKPNYYIQKDLPYFDRLRQDCREVARVPDNRRWFFTLYDCAQAPSAEGSPANTP